MRIDKELVLSFVELGIQAFSKKRKWRRALETISKSDQHLAAFKEARDVIDACADEGTGATLTVEQTAALDFVMDNVAKGGKKLRKSLR